MPDPHGDSVGSMMMNHRGNPGVTAIRIAGSEQEKLKMRSYTKNRVPSRLTSEWLAGDEQTTPPGEPSRILIIDDEANCRLGFRVTLEAAGYEVTEAEDGEEALESLRADPADLVILDLQMPLLDGVETLQCLRDEGIEVPVVVITAHGSGPRARQATKLGAIDVLPKPVKPAALRQAVFVAPMGATTLGTSPINSRRTRSERRQFASSRSLQSQGRHGRKVRSRWRRSS